jgi:superfamily II DNA or RNA helicase
MPELREFQAEDVAKVIESHKVNRCVIGRAATGLGKAVICAALAKHYVQFGKVVILVDVGKLVRQLAKTVEWFAEIKPGIEMADEYAHIGDRFGEQDNIICGTVQTQYSGDEGKERYRRIDPANVSLLVLDECETFLAESARTVVDWYLTNPDLKVFGCTATPFRGDGTPMANLFTAVAFDRDIRWGIQNGYLTPIQQGFVRVNVDFSTLKIGSGDEDERDYNAEDIARKLSDEVLLIELAKGIKAVAEKRRTIVICPTVEVSIAVAEYLNGQEAGCANAIYGELSDDAKIQLFDGHQEGKFQFLVSVMMLTKGYDDPEVSCVVNCRKTKSKRLYQQIMGRGCRVLKGIVEDATTADERRKIIAASAKPVALMVNMVGVNEQVRDVSVVDILGTADIRVNDRAAELVEEGMELDEAIAQAEDEIAEQEMVEALAMEAQSEIEANAEEVAKARQAEASWRRLVQVDARVDVAWTDDLSGGGIAQPKTGNVKAGGDGPTDKQVNALIRFGVSGDVARGYTKRQASAVLAKYFEKLEARKA